MYLTNILKHTESDNGSKLNFATIPTKQQCT